MIYGGVKDGVLLCINYGVKRGALCAKIYGVEYGVLRLFEIWGRIWGNELYKNMGQFMG